MRGEEALETEVTVTHHGPVIAGEPAAALGEYRALIAATQFRHSSSFAQMALSPNQNSRRSMALTDFRVTHSTHRVGTMSTRVPNWKT